MAKIEFTAFIEDVLSSQSGAFGLKTAEPHRRKKDDGEYETTARTFRTVKASRESGIDFGSLVKGQRVQIWGTEKTEVREHQGKKLYDLVCWCDRIEHVGSGATATGSPAQGGNSAGAVTYPANGATETVSGTPGGSGNSEAADWLSAGTVHF